jgi:threonine aldolase
MKPEFIIAAAQRYTSVMHTQPKLVFVSQTTELGTVYSKAEIEAIAQACKQCGYYLFLDGARLGYALATEGNDLSLPDIARLCDVFYIGGNKVGALIGEAVVIINPELKEGFRHVMKQKGALLAKGRLLGIQFVGLFEDDLYLHIGKNAIENATLIKKACLAEGYRFVVDSPSNMLFPILPNSVIAKMREKYILGALTKVDDDHCAVRLLTSWSTRIEDTQAFCADLAQAR